MPYCWSRSILKSIMDITKPWLLSCVTLETLPVFGVHAPYYEKGKIIHDRTLVTIKWHNIHSLAHSKCSLSGGIVLDIIAALQIPKACELCFLPLCVGLKHFSFLALQIVTSVCNMGLQRAYLLEVLQATGKRRRAGGWSHGSILILPLSKTSFKQI